MLSGQHSYLLTECHPSLQQGSVSLIAQHDPSDFKIAPFGTHSKWSSVGCIPIGQHHLSVADVIA